MKKTAFLLMLLSSMASAAVTTWSDMTSHTASGSAVLDWDVTGSELTWVSGTAESIIWTVDVSGWDTTNTYTLLSVDDASYNGLANVYISNGNLNLHQWNDSAATASSSLNSIIKEDTQTLTLVLNRSATNAVTLNAYTNNSFNTAAATLTGKSGFSFSGTAFTHLYFGGNNSTITGNGNNLVPTGDNASEWTLVGAAYTTGATATTADLQAYSLTLPYTSQRTDGTSIGRVTFIGDSITHGVNDQTYRWQFFKILTDNGIENEIVGPRSGYYNTITNTSDAGTSYGGTEFANVHLAHASGRTRNIIAGGKDSDPITTNQGVDYGGWSSAETGDAYNSDSWFCMIGTNDILSDTGDGNGISTDAYCNRMTVLLGGSVTYTDGSYSWVKGDDGWGNLGTIISDVCEGDDTFYMLSIIPWGTHNHNEDSDHYAVKEYNRNLKAWCSAYSSATGTDVKYVDVTRGLVDVTGGQVDGKITTDNPDGICFYAPNSFFNNATDRLHPNEQGSLIMAGNLAQELKIGGRTAGLERMGTEGWNSATVGTLSANTTTDILAKNAFTMEDGYTIELSAAFGDGAENGWLSMDNTLSITLGDGTNSGTLNLSEGYIMWGSDVLFCVDTSTLLSTENLPATALNNNLRIAWHNGNATDNVLQGYYVWLGDMLIGQGLDGSTSMGLNGITISANGAEGTVSTLTWTNTAYAPSLTEGCLFSEDNAYATNQDAASVSGLQTNVYQTGLPSMAADDHNNTTTSSGVDYTGITGSAVNSGACLVKTASTEDSKFVITSTAGWIGMTNNKPTGAVYAQLTGTAANAIFGTMNDADSGTLTLEIEEGATINGKGMTYGPSSNVAIAGSYASSGKHAKAAAFNVYVNGGTVNGNIIGGASSGNGTIDAVQLIINSGKVDGTIYGGAIADTTSNGTVTGTSTVGKAAIIVNGGTITGDIVAGGDGGTIGSTDVTIRGGIIKGDITKGSATRTAGAVATVTVESNKASIGGNIVADKVTLRDVEASGCSDGFDRYAGTVETPELVLDNVQAELLLRTEGLTALELSNGSNTGLVMGESITLQSLTLGAGTTFSAWKEFGASEASTENESSITLSMLSAEAGATLNANLVFTAESELSLGGTLAMGSSVGLTTGMSLTLTEDMLSSLYSGSSVELFSGVDELTLDGANVENGATLTDAVFSGLSEDYSYQLSYNNGSVSLSTIPEPTTATLSLLALAALAARRRRKA